jgi:diguanylate cyclase
VFHQRSETLVSRRSSVSSQLRAAIEGGEMELHYQPVWHLNGGRRVSGLEALLRWRHPDRGLLAAEEFMNLADQSSAGDELMDWVLSECCRQARAWRDENLVSIIGIDVSPHQLVAPGFAQRFAEQLDDHDLSAANFAVELTESAWTVDSAEVLGVIDELRLVGVAVALDDFGAGYSSCRACASSDSM